jgi:hypothetical protein
MVLLGNVTQGVTERTSFLSQPDPWAPSPFLAFTMANKALSEHVKKQKQSRLKEEKIRKAVDVYRQEQALEPHLEDWEAECSRLKAGGVRAKDLPVKPRRPLKPKPVLEVPARGDEQDDE